MTKKEQLKRAFEIEFDKLVDNYGELLLDGKTIPMTELRNNTVNTLLKEVTIRTNL